MKEARERDLAAYLRTLTPDDIRRENAYRTQQRKEGKSRKSNIKDPNAPRKPLSAYFMFLQRIRANPHLVRDIFGDETETTKQSVLAAAKWRSMTDAERQVTTLFTSCPGLHLLNAISAVPRSGRAREDGIRICQAYLRRGSRWL